MNPKELPKVAVFACPEVEPAEEAKLQLQAIAHTLHLKAADALAEGMYFEGQSVRIEQLLNLIEGEAIVRMRDRFVDEGLLEVVERVEPLTSPGGDA